MPQPLDQVTIGILEHRFTKEFTTLLQRFGATVYACPILEERPVENREELEQFVRQVAAGEFDFMNFFRGGGARLPVSAAGCPGVKKEVLQALGKIVIAARGGQHGVG